MMNDDPKQRIHEILDGTAISPACTPGEEATLARYRSALHRLEKSSVPAPAELTARVMAALPIRRNLSLREWLHAWAPPRQQWTLPALAGALAVLLALLGVIFLRPNPAANSVVVHFQIHAPGARIVELLGDFNQWRPGVVQLRGPDASGHWTADLALPEGRHEYQFLVDGNVWVTDPNAPVHRPDGFGQMNAVLDVYQGRS